jgi:hypothetical protein
MIDDQKFALSCVRIDLQPELPQRALIRFKQKLLGVHGWGRARLLRNEYGQLKIEITGNRASTPKEQAFGRHVRQTGTWVVRT